MVKVLDMESVALERDHICYPPEIPHLDELLAYRKCEVGVEFLIRNSITVPPIEPVLYQTDKELLDSWHASNQRRAEFRQTQETSDQAVA